MKTGLVLTNTLATAATDSWQSSYKQQMAAALGISVSRITVGTVTSVGTARTGNMRALATTTVPDWLFEYTLVNNNPSLSAKALVTLVTAKVESNEFAATFREYAVLYNASALANCTFGQVSYIPDPSLATNVEDPMTPGEIAGVVIGSTVFLLLLTAGVWFLVKWARSTKVEDGKEMSDIRDTRPSDNPTIAVQRTKPWLSVSEMVQSV